MNNLGSARVRHLTALATALLVIGGCTAPEATPAGSSLFGDEGIGQELELSEAPILRIGHDESNPIHNVKDAKWLGDRLVFSNAHSLLFVDRNGALLRQVGRRGEGPGEYRNLTGFDRFGDGFIAWDGFLLRLSVLDSLGHYLSSAELVHGGGRTRLVGAVGSNVLFRVTVSGFPGEGAAPPQEVQHDEDFFLVRPEDAEILATWTVPSTPRWSKREADTAARRQGGLAVLFGRDPVVAIAGDVGFIGTTGALDFIRVDGVGRAGRFILPHDTLTVKPEWEQRLRDSIAAEIDAIRPGKMVSADGVNRQMGWKRFRASLLDGLPARETLPAFSELEGDGEGRLWLREYPIPGVTEEAVWLVVDPDAGPVARVRLPPELEILDIAHEHVVVLAEGPLGQQIIEVYELRPARG